MRKAFISSATLVSGRIFDFKEYRQTDGRVVEIMGDKPVMSEDFGARPHFNSQIHPFFKKRLENMACTFPMGKRKNTNQHLLGRLRTGNQQQTRTKL